MFLPHPWVRKGTYGGQEFTSSKLIKEKEALEDEVRKLKQEREVDVRD